MYKLEILKYDYCALEPFIDTHTLGLHQRRHQQNYLDKLNEILIKDHYDFRYHLVELNYHLNEFPKNDRENILFYLGGIINHNLYFHNISPHGEEPNNFLKNKINETFGSLQDFKKKFKESAMNLKGSGYTFLILDHGKLKIINLKNQENPYYYHFIPLLTLDLWEHAYYINYENRKADYIDNFFSIMDFKYANMIFEEL